jgi:hypothetical protein
VIRECIGFVGLVVIAVGLDRISRPGAIVFAGVAMVAYAILAPERGKKKAD